MTHEKTYPTTTQKDITRRGSCPAGNAHSVTPVVQEEQTELRNTNRSYQKSSTPTRRRRTTIDNPNQKRLKSLRAKLNSDELPELEGLMRK